MSVAGAYGKRGPDAAPERSAPDRRRAALNIWLELLTAALMVPVLALAHGWGLIGMSHIFNLTDEALIHQKLTPKSILLVAFVAMLLFLLHAIEIGAVSLLYYAGGAARSFAQAFSVSASYYTTTGAGPDNLPPGWGLIGHAEALLGLLLIGWSTAFLVRKIDRLEEREGGNPEERRHRRLRRGTGFGGHERGARTQRPGK